MLRWLCAPLHATLEIRQKKVLFPGQKPYLCICLEPELSMFPMKRRAEIQVPLHLSERGSEMKGWYSDISCEGGALLPDHALLMGHMLMGHGVFPGASFSAPRWAGSCQESYCLCTEIAQGKLFHSHYCIYAEIAQGSRAVCGRWDTCQGRIMWDLLTLGPTSLLGTIQHSTELCLPLYEGK